MNETPIDIIKFDLIFAFIMFFIIIVFAILAFRYENIYDSINTSFDKDNLWCYPDIYCQDNPNENFYSANFKVINGYNSSIIDHNIIFQYINQNGGISEQTFNIYLNEEPVSESIKFNGVCAGYYNYSQLGTSIYLKYYNNGTSWNENIISNILSEAYKGTSSYLLQEAELINDNDNLTFDLKNNLNSNIGLSIYSNSSNYLFGNGSINIKYSPSFNSIDSHQLNNSIMGNYINSTKVSRFVNENSGSSHVRCIDPSYASIINCKDVQFNTSSNLYCNKNNPKCTDICLETDSFNINTMIKNNCGVPFCYNGDKPSLNYQKNDFSIENKLTNGTADPTSYTYKNTPIFSDGSIYASVNTEDFNSFVQAQNLLFCAGTSTSTNNSNDDSLLTSEGKYPTTTYSSNFTTPQFANNPNSKIKDGKYILGFK